MKNIDIHRFELNDPRLPRELWQMEEPPGELHIQGTPEALRLLERLPEFGLAVVGTREPQARSLRMIREEIQALSKTAFIVISGFARGIDTASHRAALEAGLPTIAILGSGLNVPYPRENLELKAEILHRGGLLVSEFGLAGPVYASNFLERNRLIATWAKATWVVEASLRSGALNTAKWARNHHRDVYATPCFPGDSAFAGNERLIDKEEARPFWNRTSLGETWLDLDMRSAEKCPRTQASLAAAVHPDVRALAVEVGAAERRGAGAQAPELLDWALGQGWTPQRFFDALRGALDLHAVIEREGVLTSS